jgi:hypothetical protein
LPPTWQLCLSWGGASADEEHQVLGRRSDQAARDCEKRPLDCTGPKGCSSRRLSSSFSSTEDPAGGHAGGQHPRSRLLAERDDAKNGNQTWRQRHGQASQRPFRLGDITEEGPHRPHVLLSIPLKPRDDEHALSNIRPPLASILLAPKTKEARPPRDLGGARNKSRESWGGRGVPGPLFIATSDAKP